ncbi:hypothetical protein LeptoLang_19670 [Leptospira interrogans serovar Icterohaemorrhagiae]|nr:hypothetical protein LeptoLang_19670 [Leptospira interrogans serovar Icterohaemorrhagiae]
MSFPTRPIGKHCAEFPTRPIGKRCVEFPTRPIGKRCAEFSLFLGGTENFSLSEKHTFCK